MGIIILLLLLKHTILCYLGKAKEKLNYSSTNFINYYISFIFFPIELELKRCGNVLVKSALNK